MTEDTKHQTSQSTEHTVQVSADQEMLSNTDQADLNTTLRNMNIPIEDEDSDDEKDT